MQWINEPASTLNRKPLLGTTITSLRACAGIGSPAKTTTWEAPPVAASIFANRRSISPLIASPPRPRAERR